MASLQEAALEAVSSPDRHTREVRYESLAREAHAVICPLLELASSARSRQEAQTYLLVVKNVLSEESWARCSEKERVRGIVLSATLTPEISRQAASLLAKLTLLDNLASLDAVAAFLESHTQLVLEYLVELGKIVKLLILHVEMEIEAPGLLDRVVRALHLRWVPLLQAVLRFLQPHRRLVMRIVRFVLVHLHEYSPLTGADDAKAIVINLLLPSVRSSAKAVRLVTRICPPSCTHAVFQSMRELVCASGVLEHGIILAALDFVGNCLDARSVPPLDQRQVSVLAGVALDLLERHGETCEYLWLTVVRSNSEQALAVLQQRMSLKAVALCPNELHSQYPYPQLLKEALMVCMEDQSEHVAIAECVEGWAYYIPEHAVMPTMSLLLQLLDPRCHIEARVASCVALHNVLNFSQVSVNELLDPQLAARLAVGVANTTTDALCSELDQAQSLLLMDVVLNVLRHFPGASDLAHEPLCSAYHRLIVQNEPLLHLHVLRNLLEHASPAYRQFVASALPALSSVAESAAQIETLKHMCS